LRRHARSWPIFPGMKGQRVRLSVVRFHDEQDLRLGATSVRANALTVRLPMTSRRYPSLRVRFAPTEQDSEELSRQALQKDSGHLRAARGRFSPVDRR